MDAPEPTKPLKIQRWLPYWAVLQADLHQTLRSWVYRVWVMLSIVATVGYLLYRVAVQREAGIIQPASTLISELLRWNVLASLTLIIVLTGGSISAERGTMADSVLSRGISRYQYFLGKWHARLVAVLGTFLLTGSVALLGSLFLHNNLTLSGSIVAMACILSVFFLVATCGLTVSAISNSTVLGIGVLWVLLYGIGFSLSLLPAHITSSPERMLNNLPNLLQGYYDGHVCMRLIGWSVLGSVLVSLVGMGYFSRRDV